MEQLFNYIDGKQVKAEYSFHSHNIARHIKQTCPVGKGVPRRQITEYIFELWLNWLRGAVAYRYEGKYEPDKIPIAQLKLTEEYKKVRRCCFSEAWRVIDVLTRDKSFKVVRDERNFIIGVVRIK